MDDRETGEGPSLAFDHGVEGEETDPEVADVVADVLELEEERDREEILERFRDSVREDLRTRFSDRWGYDDLLEARKRHLERAVIRYGESVAFSLAVQVVDAEVYRVTSKYPHKDDVDASAR